MPCRAAAQDRRRSAGGDVNLVNSLTRSRRGARCRPRQRGSSSWSVRAVGRRPFAALPAASSSRGRHDVGPKPRGAAPGYEVLATAGRWGRLRNQRPVTAPPATRPSSVRAYVGRRQKPVAGRMPPLSVPPPSARVTRNDHCCAPSSVPHGLSLGASPAPMSVRHRFCVDRRSAKSRVYGVGARVQAPPRLSSARTSASSRSLDGASARTGPQGSRDASSQVPSAVALSRHCCVHPSVARSDSTGQSETTSTRSLLPAARSPPTGEAVSSRPEPMFSIDTRAPSVGSTGVVGREDSFGRSEFAVHAPTKRIRMPANSALDKPRPPPGIVDVPTPSPHPADNAAQPKRAVQLSARCDRSARYNTVTPRTREKGQPHRT